MVLKGLFGPVCVQGAACPSVKPQSPAAVEGVSVLGLRVINPR